MAPFEGLVLPVEGRAGEAVAAVANKVERVTIVRRIGKEGWFAIYLEGDIDEDEYVKAANAYADDKLTVVDTEKLGDRRLLKLATLAPIYGLRVSKSLFVIVTKRNLVDEILDLHAGKKKAGVVDKLLVERLKTVKPADSPIWLATGDLEKTEIVDFSALSGLVATISLKNNADFQFEVNAATAGRTVEARGYLMGTLESVILAPLFGISAKEEWEEVCKAAGMKVKQDGKTVTATGSIPAKFLIDKYAKQK